MIATSTAVLASSVGAPSRSAMSTGTPSFACVFEDINDAAASRISSSDAVGFSFCQSFANGGPDSGSSPPPAAIDSRAQFSQVRAASVLPSLASFSAAAPIMSGEVLNAART
jgi:hypothetical protein